MKDHSFHEDFESDLQDPLDGKHADFPWEELFKSLDGIADQYGDEVLATAGDALVELFRAILGNAPVRKGFDRMVGRRFMALVWTIRPDVFDETPSLSKLSKQLGINKVLLSYHAAKTSRRWGIRNRAQSHGWNWKPQQKGST